MNRKGITLIELLVALSVSGVLVAGIYKTFVSQQHTYSVQDQLVDMQQNVRLAINVMTRELRMAGFGGGGVSGWTASEFFNHGTIYGSYSGVVNPGPGGTSVTVVEGFEPLVRTTLAANALTDDNSITLNDVSSFDAPPGARRYISINGTEAHQILSIDTVNKKITFHGWDTVIADHPISIDGVPIGVPIYLIGAVTYSVGMFDGKSCLLRDDHLGGGPQPVADNIESLQFEFFDVNGNVTLVPADIRMIRVRTVVKSDQVDQDLRKGGDGYRRRALNTNIQLRNLLF